MGKSQGIQTNLLGRRACPRLGLLHCWPWLTEAGQEKAVHGTSLSMEDVASATAEITAVYVAGDGRRGEAVKVVLLALDGPHKGECKDDVHLGHVGIIEFSE